MRWKTRNRLGRFTLRKSIEIEAGVESAFAHWSRFEDLADDRTRPGTGRRIAVSARRDGGAFVATDILVVAEGAALQVARSTPGVSTVRDPLDVETREAS